jgi:hypothetical protein
MGNKTYALAVMLAHGRDEGFAGQVNTLGFEFNAADYNAPSTSKNAAQNKLDCT